MKGSGWAIKAPNGYIDPFSFRFTRKVAINEYSDGLIRHQTGKNGVNSADRAIAWKGLKAADFKPVRAAIVELI